MKKILTAAALGAALLFGGAASCDPVEHPGYYPVEIPDCDADDKVGKWDTEDCGPSPVPSKAKTPSSNRSPMPRRSR